MALVARTEAVIGSDIATAVALLVAAISRLQVRYWRDRAIRAENALRSIETTIAECDTEIASFLGSEAPAQKR
ncbi:hypothetical protein NOVOSPHI9U_40401 [Novosphingobium sp. 9U]|nr:hypothetical protein NOVOSPHI9U_40401 [Novosphingobium sp. 9U]